MAAVLALVPACRPAEYVYVRGAGPPPVAAPAAGQRCWQEPYTVERVVPRDGERIVHTGSADELCTIGPDDLESCVVLSETQWLAWRTERTLTVHEMATYCDGTAQPTQAPAPSYGGGPVHVRGYYRRDGTYVHPHTRSRPRR